jgi:hypothetical protein
MQVENLCQQTRVVLVVYHYIFLCVQILWDRTIVKLGPFREDITLLLGTNLTLQTVRHFSS